MKRLDQIREVLWLEAVASKAIEAAGELRRTLQYDAEAQYKAEGHAGSWHFPDIAKVTLPVSKQAIVVTDSSKFQGWVAANHPAEIEHVAKVREGFTQNLCERLAETDGDVVFMPGTGEVIPGLSVRQGGTPRALSIRAEPAAKAALAAYAARGLERATLEAQGPVVLAEIEAGNG